MNDQEAVDLWVRSMHVRGLSDKTLKRRTMSVRRFRRFLAERDQTLLSATADDVETWLYGLRKANGQPIKSQSRGLYLGDLRAFFRWAVRHDVIAGNPCDKLDPPNRPRMVPRPIATKDLAFALDQADGRTRKMLLLAGYAGLRAAEIAELTTADVDFEAMTLRIHGKGDKYRVVPMHPEIAAAIAGTPRGPVITHSRQPGQGVSAGTVSRLLCAYFDRLNIDAVGHQCRHWFGSESYASSQDLRVTQALLGHSSPQTTAGYVAHSERGARDAVASLNIKAPKRASRKRATKPTRQAVETQVSTAPADNLGWAVPG